MAWYTVEEYAKLENISVQGVYKRIKNEKVNTLKGESGQILVQKDSKQDIPHIIYNETPDLNEGSINSQIETIKDFFESLISEIKLSKENEIKTILESKEQLKDNYERLLASKDSELVRMKDELDKLKGKGFFKRLFGG
ncbi:MAG: hypothetical protein OEZ36_00060 [Spirochaetota bacterium]|nr:hypothetical protein [Spirochaetota bacterium]